MSGTPVVVDTNLLLAAAQGKLHLESELERIVGGYAIIIPTGVLDELDRIGSAKSIQARHAKLAAQIVRTRGWQIVEHPPMHTDDAIVNIASERDCMIATQDRELKRRIRDIPRRLIVLRGHNHLELM